MNREESALSCKGVAEARDTAPVRDQGQVPTQS
jgi:hypothetical protein